MNPFILIPVAWVVFVLGVIWFLTLAGHAQQRRTETERWLRDCTLLEVDGRCDVCGTASETSMCDRCDAEVDLAYERLMDRD